MADKKELTDNNLTRAFICIEFPDEVVKEIARVQEVLENRKFAGKMTELENLHLTFKFLGELDDKKLEKVKEALRKVEFKDFEAYLGEAGTFSFHGNPRIAWIKVCGENIWNLQKKVDNALEGIFSKEERFMSHLTIARVKYVEDKTGFKNYVKNLGVKEIKFKVEKFYLKKSELKEDGPIYSVIEEYRLRD